MEVDRRRFLRTVTHAAAGLTAAGTMGVARAAVRPRLPNIVIIFADDLGYGDLGCYGHPTIRTPNLNRMSAEGTKLTQFYSAAPVCTPSRAALLTGRLPIRNGMCSDKRGVLFPDSSGGLPDSEITLAQALKTRGYATCCVGKWHLGHLPKYLPTRRGFDEYFGIPYSNDMKPSPLLDGERTVEEPADQASLTRRYTDRALDFLERQRRGPFLLYYAHTFPHVPLHASDAFRGKSLRGLYGDVVEELDWSVGQVRGAIERLRLARSTLVLFTSDNGPWLTQNLNGGSAGLLRGGKGSTWEGGMREPCLACWPGTIPAGRVCTDLAATLDVFPMCLGLAGVPLPSDREMDGVDLLPVLCGTGPGARESMFFYQGATLWAARKGPWKAHIRAFDGPDGKAQDHDPPLLYNLDHDPSERFDVADKRPDVVADLLKTIADHRATVRPVPSQLEARIGS
jgi:arylsulfatase A